MISGRRHVERWTSLVTPEMVRILAGRSFGRHFLGGDTYDASAAVAVDPGGDIDVAGHSTSSKSAQMAISCVPASAYANFNSSLTFQQNCVIGPVGTGPAPPSFIAKISSDGARLLYLTGINAMATTALAVNSRGEAFVAAAGPGVTQAPFLFHLSATSGRSVDLAPCRQRQSARRLRPIRIKAPSVTSANVPGSGVKAVPTGTKFLM